MHSLHATNKHFNESYFLSPEINEEEEEEKKKSTHSSRSCVMEMMMNKKCKKKVLKAKQNKETQ